MLLLPEEGMVKAWEPSKKQCFFGYWWGVCIGQESSSPSLQRVVNKADCPHNIVHNYVQNPFQFLCRILPNLIIWWTCTLHDPTRCDYFLRDRE